MIYYLASQINEVIERQVARPARSITLRQNQPFQLHGSYYMADTISISTKHGIKSYAGDIKLCDACSYVANTTLYSLYILKSRRLVSFYFNNNEHEMVTVELSNV
jgi:hypothetical protein